MTVRIERNDGIATVVIARADKRNAVDAPTARALFEAFEMLDADDDVDAMVLYGDGGTFCSGADLSTIGTARGNTVEPEGPGPMGPTRMVLSKPTVAAIDGYAVAGGLELALWCDLRVAGDDAVLGVLCRRWGVPLVDGGTVRLPRIVGLSRALDLILTGREVGAQEALSLGLVDRVVPAGGARPAAEKLAREIAAFPSTCMRNDRLSVYEGIGMDEASAMRNEFDRGIATIESGEMESGIAQFFE